MAARSSSPTPRRGGPREVGPRRREADRGGALLEIQRVRMVTALVEIVGERGLAGVTVAHVVTRSGVSRRTFYELFADREDCLLAAFDQAVETAAQRVLPAFNTAQTWTERIRAGLTELLAFLEEQPGIGRLLLVEMLAAGPVALERRARIVAALVDAVDGGGRALRAGPAPSADTTVTRVTAEGVVGAVLGVLHTRLVGGDSGSTTDLLGALMAIVVLPYGGAPELHGRRRDPYRRVATRSAWPPIRCATSRCA